MRLQPGVRLGAYEIVSLVGAGGMGEVYRARDTRLDRIVAIKVLPGADPELKIRFDREARAISSLDHPNVCALYDVGHEDDVDYLVMQYLEGETLASRIERGPLPVADALRVARDVASALQAAHRRGIVHRDLKPANIFLCSSADSVSVKLLDFGLAAWRAPAPGSQTVTTLGHATTQPPVSDPGRAVGTLPYMAPEQLEGRFVDARADVFAFGAVLFEMVTGRRAFMGATPMAVAGSILHDEPPTLSALRSDVPPVLDRVTKKCLSKQPEDRFANGGELATELQDLGGLSHDRRAARRQSTVVGLAIELTTIVALTAAVIYLVTEHRSSPEIGPLDAATTTLAVLPFEPDSSDAGQRAYWTGLSEAVTTKLAALPASYRLTVLSQGEMRRNGVRDARTARTELGATHVIRGTVSSSAARATVELSDASTGRVIGVQAISLDPGSDSRAMEVRVLDVLVPLLGLRLVARDRAVLLAGEGGAGAYDFYLQALGYLQDYDRPENIDTAIALFRHALDLDANDALAYSGLGHAYWTKYLATKDQTLVETARQACERGLGLDEREAAPHACLGTVESGVGRYEKAVEEFQHALTREPDSDSALLGLATAYQRLGRSTEAEDTFKRAISVRPRYWAGYSRLGAFYHGIGRFADAEQMFRQVVALLPDSWRGYSNIGALLYVEGKSDEAIAAFEKSWALQPNYQAASNLGTLYFYEKSDYRQAASAFKRALTVDDKQFVVWGNYAAALHWSADEPAARTAFLKASMLAEESRKTNPRDAHALLSLATYYAALGERDRPRALMEQALVIDPESPALLFEAATLCEYRFHDRVRALQLLDAAVTHGYQWKELERAPALAALRRDKGFAELRKHTTQAP